MNDGGYLVPNIYSEKNTPLNIEIGMISQLGNDILVINKIYPNKRGGYFIELGAHNGVHLSNTLLLEKKYGWNGICIEPHPKLYEELQKNRNCETSNDLAFSVEGETVNFSLSDVFSGITDHIDKYDFAKKGEQIVLTTTTLTDILDKHVAPSYIEYMSLDTEGTELEILRGLDMTKYKIGFMSVEHNFIEPRRTEIRKYLFSKGYSLYNSVKHDDNFILNNDSRIKKLVWNKILKKFQPII